MNGIRLVLGVMACWAAAVPDRLQAQVDEPYQAAPIFYSETEPRDGVARVQERIRSGRLEFRGSDREILRQLLSELRVPESSQVLLFTKTSLQRQLISPGNPRAIYFSDDCYVGWVPGGLMEVATVDPNLGPVFYAFDPHLNPGATNRFTRDADCLRCHGGTFVRGIPGILARSVPTDALGEPLLQFGSLLVDHTTPFADRWGGWYVTGQHGTARHRGNMFAVDDRGELRLDLEAGANLSRLPAVVDPGKHLRPTSDIVALMVFEHHLTVHNALTRAMVQCRRMLHYQKSLQQDLSEEVSDEPRYTSTRNVFENSAQEVLDALLFKDEAAMPEGGVSGSADFQKDYTGQGPRTRDGLSLRDLDLKTRLFRYRCSPLIYCQSFAHLPEPLRKRVTTRLRNALEHADAEPRYAYLRPGERRMILEILRETLPGFH